MLALICSDALWFTCVMQQHQVTCTLPSNSLCMPIMVPSQVTLVLAATQKLPLPAAMQRLQDDLSAAGTVTQYFLSLLPSSINTISLGLVVEANTNASSLAPYKVSIAGAQADLRPGVGYTFGLPGLEPCCPQRALPVRWAGARIALR